MNAPSRIDEMQRNADIKRGERFDELMQDAPPVVRRNDPSWRISEAERERIMRSLTAGTPPTRTRPVLEGLELLDIVDGLTALLSHAKLSESDFSRIQITRDRLASIIDGLTPKVSR